MASTDCTCRSIAHLTGGKSGDVASQAEHYTHTYYSKGDSAAEQEKVEEHRKASYEDVVCRYYDQATDFYEYGWGQSFHFAPMRRGEAYSESQARHQHRLALKVKADVGMKVLDVGSGVGGPGREIAQLSGADVVGININHYQVERARRISAERGMSSKCTYVEGDFHKMPFEDNSFDAVYAVEATCHSPDLSLVYGEACRVLKPGCLFGAYEWIYTDEFDSENKVHRDIIDGLLEGNGLPCLSTEAEVRAAVKKAGLELLQMEDLALTSSVSWYSPLTFGKDITRSIFRSTAIGRKTTQAMLMGMEALGRAPKGMTNTHAMLCRGADGLVEAGKLGIFSPMLFFLARKPL